MTACKVVRLAADQFGDDDEMEFTSTGQSDDFILKEAKDFEVSWRQWAWIPGRQA